MKQNLTTHVNLTANAGFRDENVNPQLRSASASASASHKPKLFGNTELQPSSRPAFPPITDEIRDRMIDTPKYSGVLLSLAALLIRLETLILKKTPLTSDEV
jgi:hypothetical protein